MDHPVGLVSPTVIADDDNSDRLAREQIFGPVLTLTPYDTDDEAIAPANDSEFGLGGSIGSTDTGRATNVAWAVIRTPSESTTTHSTFARRSAVSRRAVSTATTRPATVKGSLTRRPVPRPQA